MDYRSILFAFLSLAFSVETSKNLVEASRIRRATSLSQVQAIYNRFKKKVRGDGTYYGNYPVGRGQCTLDPLSPMATQAGWIRVAAGPATYQRSLGCGMCLEITGTGTGSGNNPIVAKTKAVIVVQCASGCGDNGMDFFIPGDGRWKINWIAIDCPTIPGSNGNIQLRFQGSNPWYIKLQARNTRIPTAGIEALVNGGPSSIKRFGQGDKSPYPPGGMNPGDPRCKDAWPSNPFAGERDCHSYVICSSRSSPTKKFSCGKLAFNPVTAGCDDPRNVPNCQ